VRGAVVHGPGCSAGSPSLSLAAPTARPPPPGPLGLGAPTRAPSRIPPPTQVSGLENQGRGTPHPATLAIARAGSI
jgi:hypothetical protein